MSRWVGGWEGKGGEEKGTYALVGAGVGGAVYTISVGAAVGELVGL